MSLGRVKSLLDCLLGEEAEGGQAQQGLFSFAGAAEGVAEKRRLSPQLGSPNASPMFNRFESAVRSTCPSMDGRARRTVGI
jgi:hypothetical protein